MKRMSLFLGAVFSLTLPLLYSASAWAQFVPAPPCDQVKIVGTPVVAGTGCPAGTARVVIASTTAGCKTADFIEVLFDEFTAEKGPGIPFSMRRQQCTVQVTLRLPSGLRFTVDQTHYEGYAHLGSSDTGTLTSDYFIAIPPAPPHATSTKTIHGPFDGNFTKDDTLSFLSLVWPPMCHIDVPANLRSILTVSGPSTSNAVITVDQFSSKLHQLWGLKWAACP